MVAQVAALDQLLLNLVPLFLLALLLQPLAYVEIFALESLSCLLGIQLDREGVDVLEEHLLLRFFLRLTDLLDVADFESCILAHHLFELSFLQLHNSVGIASLLRESPSKL